MMQYTVLPFVAVFYNQYYCEVFCGCTNLRYIETKTFWLIFHQCIEHGLLLIFLKLRESILFRHNSIDFFFNLRSLSSMTLQFLFVKHQRYIELNRRNGGL